MVGHESQLSLDISVPHAIALVILALSLASAAIKARSLQGALRSAARWETGGPTGSVGSRLRFKAFSESMQIAPPAWDRAALLEWAHSSKAKERFKVTQAVTAQGLRAAAQAADYSDAREREWRRAVAAERRAGIAPDVVVLCISLVIAVLAFVGTVA